MENVTFNFALASGTLCSPQEMIRTKFQKCNFRAVVSPSTFIRKTDMEIKDNETQTSKEKSKRKEAEIKKEHIKIETNKLCTYENVISAYVGLSLVR